ncbi:MAG: methyltransferase, CheR-type with sensor [Gemmatimonadetes bacterium]|nr:methyltransferase, CheR-type with sensor [Gemmatimonadota bacterium]
MTSPVTDAGFEALLEYLKRRRSFDFTGYKRSTLSRRVEKRMSMVDVATHADYVDFLEVHPEEFEQLFNTILINVTSFFRDPEAWEALTRDVVPALAERSGGGPIRVWSAGCASGQETYTLVMALAEALGHDAFRERVKVYATDLDDEALGQARSAVYSAKEMEGLPDELRARYFEPGPDDTAVFRGDLRRHVIFGRHDLVQDAPISHLDLLVCRNTLMYFNAEVQSRILARFHFALNTDGILFLGKAEMMRTHAGLFAPVNLKARLFAKIARTHLRERLVMMGQASEPPAQRDGLHARLRDAALAAGPAAQVVVDPRGALVLANDPARRLFDLSEADVGRPIQDLKLSYRPLDLRSRMDLALAEGRAVAVTGVEHPGPDGEPRTFDVQITPLLSGGRSALGVSIAFVDVTRSQRLQSELEGTNQELETAYEELQSTNEELETTNEELQSTIEELETTNEELQSTNEELETMNEELQSTNEELETINDELRRRTEELNTVNAYMSSILTSLRVGVVVIDRELRVRVWNRKAEDLWGLRADEVDGHPVLNLDIGLPMDGLKATIRAALDGRVEPHEVVLDATNRRGRAIRCRVTGTPLTTKDREVRGAILLMEEWTGDGHAA